MRGAIFMAMAITLMRDRAALAMAFVLPAIFFVIFAVIFTGASGGDLTVRLAVADEQGSDASKRLVEGLREDGGIKFLGDGVFTAAEVRSLVRGGEADVGLVVRGQARRLTDLSGEGPAPLEIIGDPTREIPVAVVQGVVQKVFFTHLSDAVLQALAPAQGLGVAPGAGPADVAPPQAASTPEIHFDRLFERIDAVGDPEVSSAVSYYVGAVAAMFLLFSSLNGAISLLAERESGLLDRIAAGPAGVGAVVDGKFAFLVAQGVVQTTIIFLVAWVGFGVSVIGNLATWALTTVIASIAASALALGFVAACRTQIQAHTLGTIAVVIVSALGGSMVPRFLMPEAVREFGWATPNAWVIEAYGSILWRNGGLDELFLPWAILAAIGAAGLAAAHVFSQRRT